jgi:hypothetical protein
MLSQLMVEKKTSPIGNAWITTSRGSIQTLVKHSLPSILENPVLEGTGREPPLQRDGTGTDGTGRKLPIQRDGTGRKPPIQRDGAGRKPQIQRDGTGRKPPIQRDGTGRKPQIQRDGTRRKPPFKRDGIRQKPPFQRDLRKSIGSEAADVALVLLIVNPLACSLDVIR